MDNKGFTLVELLLTISILGVIMALAISSYVGISNNIREGHRNNLISEIEIKASDYAFDTRKTIIFVNDLVVNGYISSDEDGNIYDPISNERMNCYIVEMEKVGDYYKAKFLDDKTYEIDGICDDEAIKNMSEDIYIEVINNSKIIRNHDDYLKGDVLIKVYSNTLEIDCSVNECLWTSKSGAEIENIDEVVLNDIIGILDTTYTFQYTVNTEDPVEIYTKSVDIKIDNEKPKINEDEINITDRYVYTSSKEVTISASDNGSGIEMYYLGKNNGDSCDSDNLKDEYQSSNVFDVDEKGYYLICVKDKAGNFDSYDGLYIDYIS